MRRLLPLPAALLLALPSLAADAPRPVSPASPGGLAAVASACPAFSWTATGDARGYEVVVLRVEGESPVGEPVIEEALPRGASSWTPSAERCLEPGSTYAWLVRAVGRGGSGAWSEASLFQVAAPAGREDLEAALEVVRRHLAAGGELPAAGTRPPAVAAVEAAPPPSPGPPAPLVTKASPANFSVAGTGHVTSQKLTVGADAPSASHLATFANSDFNGARVRLAGRNLSLDVGPTLDLDASGSSSAGRSFSLTSTAANSLLGAGKLAVWDDTSDLYRLSIDGEADTVKVRNLALSQVLTSTSSTGTTAEVACGSGQTLTGGGCLCSSAQVRASFPNSGDAWSCVCSPEATSVFVYAVCIESTPP